MTVSVLVLLAAAMLWGSIRLARVCDLTMLPAASRRRVQWCERHARLVILACLALGFAGALLALRAAW